MNRTTRRRAPGEGGLYQRPDGRWEGTVSLGLGPNGKRRKRKVIGKTQGETSKRLAALRQEFAAGLDVDAFSWTVSTWLDRWLDTVAAARLRPRTLAVYRSSLELHVIPALGHLRLRTLRPDHIERYMVERSAAGVKPQTVKNEFAVLRRALEVATQRGYVTRNVARLATAPRIERQEVCPLTPEEVREFLQAAEGHPLEALFVLAAATGLRRGEVLGLTWSAVDLDGGAIRVERTLVRLNREFSLAQPKTQQSRRAVAIPDAVVRVLRSHRVRQLEGKLGAATWRNEWDLVFTREDGTPIEPRWLHTQFVGLLDASGVRRVRFHDLRHGAATVLLLRGVPMKVVQDVLGHSQMKMTSDLYSHVLPELRREAADQMGAALFGH